MTALNACHAKQKTALMLFFHHTVYVIEGTVEFFDVI